MNKRLLVILLIANFGSRGAFAISPNISTEVMPLKEKGESRAAIDVNNSDQLTDGIVSQPIPVQITEEPRAKQVTCGASHTVILRTDHSVGWLGFYDAQVPPQGEKNFSEQKDRLRVLNNIGNIIQVASGDEHTLLLRSDGTVWAYGKGEKGQLGNGQNRHSLVAPVRVSGITNALAIAAGGDSSLAIFGDGFVATWGSNESGQLGDGTTENRSVPVTITEFADGSKITGAAMGKNHALVRREDGTVWIWGSNKDQQILGNSESMITTPQKIPELSKVKTVAAGEGYSLALLENKTVFAWGASPESSPESSPDGQNRQNTGLGTPLVTSTPTQIPGLENVVQIAVGSSHALARLQNGTLKAWGNNDHGQLGDGTFNSRNAPVAVKNLTGITNIAAGKKHSSAVRNDATAWSWGSNENQQLGLSVAREHRSAMKLTASGIDTQKILFGTTENIGKNGSPRNDQPTINHNNSLPQATTQRRNRRTYRHSEFQRARRTKWHAT